MKSKILLLFLGIASLVQAQRIYPYEKEISEKSNYNFLDISYYDSISKVKIYGSAITPKAAFTKLVIIVPGSGKDTRHSHFLLAEEFLKNNIAVFRYDEPGTGASEGSFDPSATSLESASNYAFRALKGRPEFKNIQIGILGHSLGGYASLHTYEANKPDVGFLIQMAAPVTAIADDFLWRAANGDTDFFYIENRTKDEVVSLLKSLYATITENKLASYSEIRKKAIEKGIALGYKKKMFLKFLMGDQISHILHENIDRSYATVSIPMLYIIGGNDTFINHEGNTGLLASFNNANIKISVVSGLNHWLTQRNAPPGTSLYQMDEAAIKTIIDFVRSI